MKRNTLLLALIVAVFIALSVLYNTSDTTIKLNQPPPPVDTADLESMRLKDYQTYLKLKAAKEQPDAPRESKQVLEERLKNKILEELKNNSNAEANE